MIPGSRAPGVVQLVEYGRDPLGFLAKQQRRYGDIFAIHFPYFGQIVYVAEPSLVKALFTGDPAVFHAGEANATVLEPALGPNSVLTLDDEPHLRQRKLLLPPFHGERVERYGELILEITREEMESWPVGEPFALRPHTQRITLAVIMRAVFGVHDERRLARFEGLIDEFARRVGLVASIPPLRRNLGGLSPWGRFLRSRRALDAFIYEEIALRRAEAGREDATTCSRCCSAPATRTAGGWTTANCATRWSRCSAPATRRRRRGSPGRSSASPTTPPCWRSCATRWRRARRTTWRPR
jgi:cytochrome P450